MPFRRIFDEVSTFEWALAGFVFAVIFVVLVVAAIKYRARPGREASQKTEHTLIESVYAVVLLAVAIVIVTVTARANADDYPTGPKPALHVEVTGFQWCWSFHYVESDVTVTATCGEGDYPVLELPVGKRVEITTTSVDVIHSFWVPHFRYKMDAEPNHVNRFDITIPTAGQWLGHCAELCGINHAVMLFYLRAVPADQYQQWVSTQHGSTVVS